MCGSCLLLTTITFTFVVHLCKGSLTGWLIARLFWFHLGLKLLCCWCFRSVKYLKTMHWRQRVQMVNVNPGLLLLGYAITCFCQESGRTLYYGKRYFQSYFVIHCTWLSCFIVIIINLSSKQNKLIHFVCISWLHASVGLLLKLPLFMSWFYN